MIDGGTVALDVTTPAQAFGYRKTPSIEISENLGFLQTFGLA